MESSSGVWSLKKIRKDESLWEEAQKKTFCGWINMHLAKRNIRVTDLSTDLSDGVKLIALLEILHGSTIEGRYYRNPKSKPYKIDNVNFALNFITDTLKIQLISCSAEDVVDGNTKIILGMCWRLIQKFQLSQENSRAVLLNWCKQLASKYNLLIENFQSSFDNGLAFCALIHYYNNSLLDYAGLKPENKLHNLNLAFSLAEEHMEIPQLLDATDISNGIVDERSIMTYLSMIHHAISLKAPSDVGGGEAAERVVVASIPIIRTGSFNPSEQVVVNSSASAPKSQAAGGSAVSSAPVADNSHLYAEIASLKEKVNFLEAQISTSAAAERELQTQLENTRRDLASAISKAKELENQLEAANQQNTNLHTQLRSIEQQLSAKSDHETSKELEIRTETPSAEKQAPEPQEDSTKDESKTETTKGEESTSDDDSKRDDVTDDSKTQISEEPSSKQESTAVSQKEPKPKVEEPAAPAEAVKEAPKEEPKAPEVKKEEPAAPAEAVKEEPAKVEEPQKEEPKEAPKEQVTHEEPAKVVETKADEPKEEVKVEAPPKVEESQKEEAKAPVELSKDLPVAAAAGGSGVPSGDQDKLISDLQNEISETREKLRQQVKVSETLQKSLEDTREEIVLIQKRQKRTQDKALKKQQKKYEKRIQRRDREIENLKKNAQVELQQKVEELASVNKQLKKAQKALGTTVAPHTSALDADIEYLKQQKDQLYEIVQLFEEEEKAMAKKSTRRIEDEEEKERSEETEA